MWTRSNKYQHYSFKVGNPVVQIGNIELLLHLGEERPGFKHVCVTGSLSYRGHCNIRAHTSYKTWVDGTRGPWLR